MSLTKQVTIDSIEVVTRIEGEYVNIREKTTIIDEGQVISESYHRRVIRPGDDYLNETEKVKSICDLIYGVN